MNMFRRLGLAVVLCGGLIVLVTNAFGGSQPGDPLHDAATGRLKPPTIPAVVPSAIRGASGIGIARPVPWLSGGLLATEAASLSMRSARSGHASALTLQEQDQEQSSLGPKTGSLGCGARNPDGGTRVTQDCGFNLQAEEMIASNPTEPHDLIASQDDERLGDDDCYRAWSTDGGPHWGNDAAPINGWRSEPGAETSNPSDTNSHTLFGNLGTGHKFDYSTDPGVAFDATGRSYFSCLVADVSDPADGVYGVSGPPLLKGATPNNVFTGFSVAVEDNNAHVLYDKPFITADSYPKSPNVNNPYLTWTTFFFDSEGRFLREVIYGSMSTNRGFTWSTPEEISGNSPQLCFFGNFFDPSQSPSQCDLDQGSDPKVLPDGRLAVVFNNGNTPANDPNGQQLGVVCHPSGSSPAGTAHLNCGTPSKIGDDVLVGEPACGGELSGQECIPGAFVRANDFPRLAVNPSNGHLYAVWNDYRNGEFDIQMASSADGGQTWGATQMVNPDTGLDHYFGAVDVGKEPGPDRVGVSYYRTQRVPNENTTPSGGFVPGQPGVKAGQLDYVLAGGTGLSTPYRFTVLSPIFPPPDGIQSGFIGDYTGLTIPIGTEAHPIWADTRNTVPFAIGHNRDLDTFTTTAQLPNGVGKAGPGTIGQSR
jgi:hypothetical protein